MLQMDFEGIAWRSRNSVVWLPLNIWETTTEDESNWNIHMHYLYLFQKTSDERKSWTKGWRKRGTATPKGRNTTEVFNIIQIYLNVYTRDMNIPLQIAIGCVIASLNTNSTRKSTWFHERETIKDRCRKSLSFFNSKYQFFSASPRFVFFWYSRATRVISQISQSRQRTLTLTLENWRGHFSRTFSFVFVEY